MRFTKFEDDLHKRLRDREFAMHYLGAALEESVEEFLYAIREVASAQEGGLRGVAERAGVGRESMYKSLSKTGNPQFRAVESILAAMGLTLCVTTADAPTERGNAACAAGWPPDGPGTPDPRPLSAGLQPAGAVPREPAARHHGPTDGHVCPVGRR